MAIISKSHPIIAQYEANIVKAVNHAICSYMSTAFADNIPLWYIQGLTDKCDVLISVCERTATSFVRKRISAGIHVYRQLQIKRTPVFADA